MSDTEKISAKKLCLACQEPIHDNAVICPHCRSSQSPNKWRTIGLILKWIAGITAVISLLLNTWQLNNIISVTRERSKSVAQLRHAAERQEEAGDFKRALQLLEEALKLEPGSWRTRAKQVSLAMAILREYEFADVHMKYDKDVLASLTVISGAKSSQNHRFKTGQIETRTSYPIHGQHAEIAMRFFLFFEKETSYSIPYRSPLYGFTDLVPGSFANATSKNIATSALGTAVISVPKNRSRNLLRVKEKALKVFGLECALW